MSYISGMLLRYFRYGFEMVQVALSLLESLFLHILHGVFLLQSLWILKYFRIIIIMMIIIIIIIVICTEILSSSVCDRNCIVLSLWQKLYCPQSVTEIVLSSVCDRNCIVLSLWQKLYCPQSVTEIVLSSVCDRNCIVLSLWQNVTSRQ